MCFMFRQDQEMCKMWCLGQLQVIFDSLNFTAYITFAFWFPGYSNFHRHANACSGPVKFSATLSFLNSSYLIPQPHQGTLTGTVNVRQVKKTKEAINLFSNGNYCYYFTGEFYSLGAFGLSFDRKIIHTHQDKARPLRNTYPFSIYFRSAQSLGVTLT